MNEIEIYETSDGESQVEVRFEQETVWLSQQQMADLFGQTKQNVSLHINNCYKEGELNKNATVKDYLTVDEKRLQRSMSTRLGAQSSAPYKKEIESFLATYKRLNKAEVEK